MTAYEFVHGRKADEKLTYFGEKVCGYIPNARPATFDLKWQLGISLGTLMKSNGCYSGVPNGHVTTARRIVRIRLMNVCVCELCIERRWNPSSASDGLDDAI